MNPSEATRERLERRPRPSAAPTAPDFESEAPNLEPAPIPAPAPEPPRGPRLWKLLLGVVLLGVIFWVGAVWGDNMLAGFNDLWDRIAGEPEAEDAHDDNQFWTCGMHPWVILPEPGLCPICHMDLTPLDPAKLTGEIAIDPVVVQNIGVRIAPVTTGPLVREIRTVGSVTYDESTVRTVNTKIAGWIEELYVDQEGAVIQAGQPLFDLYSPELYAAQEEYLQAWRNRDQVSAEFLPEAARGAQSLLEATRTRLTFFDVSDEQIEQLQESGEVRKTITVSSPHAGVVVEKNVQEGTRVEPGTLIYRIADLSKVWVIATLYEYQLPYIQVGQPAVMTLPYLPGETFEGKVAYIYPYLNAEARQVRVRLEFDNRDGRLKPGMFANIELRSRLDQEAILVPRDAVIATGEREVAFVSLGNGRFEPREVDIGVQTGAGMVEVLDGLKPGEQVVVSGQFLLDSESKMRSALAKMVKGDLAADQEPDAEVAETTVTAPLPQGLAQALDATLRSYIAIGDLLASDKMSGVATHAQQLAARLDQLPEHPVPKKPHFWHENSGFAAARGKALELAETKDLATARLQYAALSKAIYRLYESTGVPLSFGERVTAMTCPMFPPKQNDAVWLQPVGDPRNPYMGRRMLGCVGEQTMLPVAGAPGAAPTSAPPASLNPQEQKLIDQLTRDYLAIQQALVANKVAGIDPRLETMRAASLELAESADPQVRRLAEELAQAAARQPEDLAKMRAAFKSISTATVQLVQVAPPTETAADQLTVAYCEMAAAPWLQTNTKQILNPYYGVGDAMYRCGEIQKTIQPRPTSKE